ncbi:histone H1.1, embryonic-like [Penaeus indicus]|uniref:histone H1.1, embryonic-like n=1 Tax=Penaeus indicus TaxID=29960 RepID=UPI00300C888B
MTLVPKTPKTPSTPRTPAKSLRIPKSTLKTPRSLKAPRTLRTPRQLKASVRSSAKTPRANAKPLTIGDMVFEAVEALNDRRGVSLHSIKKYLRDNKKVDAEAKALSIKKHLKAFVEEGKLVQVAGTGANGTFKIPGKKTSSQKASACSKVITKVASRPKIGKILSGKKDQVFRNAANMHQRVSKKALKGKMEPLLMKYLPRRRTLCSACDLDVALDTETNHCLKEHFVSLSLWHIYDYILDA